MESNMPYLTNLDYINWGLKSIWSITWEPVLEKEIYQIQRLFAM